MGFYDAINAFNRIIDAPLTLNGFTFSIEQLLIYFGLGAILCFIVGGMLK